MCKSVEYIDKKTYFQMRSTSNDDTPTQEQPPTKENQAPLARDEGNISWQMNIKKRGKRD